MKAVIEIMNTRDQTASYVNSGDNVKLVVYPRIHMFPVDVSLISGIVKNGSLGYSLMNMPIEISVKINHTSKDSIHVEGDVDIKKLDFKIDFDKLRLYIRSSDHYNVIISVSASVREHTGLGMSTQILGGVYLCCARISNRDLKINDLYNIGLGHHSALGLNLLFNPGMIFEMGTTISKKGEGFIVNPKLSQEYESIANTVYKVNQFPFYSIIAIPKQASSVSDKYGDSFFNDTLPNKKVDS
jgi:predicted sugar kinase